MSVEIKKVKTVLDLCEVIRLASKHTHPEYSCDFNTYANYLVNYYYNKDYYMLLAICDNLPVGYLIYWRNSGLQKEYLVTDIFVDKLFQKSGVGLYLVKELITIGVPDKEMERIKWTSNVFPRKFWEKWSPVKVYEEQIFYSTREDYEKLFSNTGENKNEGNTKSSN